MERALSAVRRGPHIDRHRHHPALPPLSRILQMHCRAMGQWFQSESGLHQNWMRDYDPTTGRYIQADPPGLVDGASVYGYVKGNPGRWIDPKGLWTLNLGVSISANLGPLGGVFGFGIALDGCGNIAFYTVYSPLGGLAFSGGPMGGGKGTRTNFASGREIHGGMAVGASNAKTVYDLTGEFSNANFAIGSGRSVGGGVYTGDSANGRVTGGELSFGGGMGAGTWLGKTWTDIYPLYTGITDCNCGH